MKKQVALLLSVCATLSAISMLTACGGGHKHTWDEGKITTKATATTEGVKTFTCTGCEQTKTEPYTLSTTITEEEWDALLLLDNFTIDGMVTERGLQETADFIVTENAVFSENEEPDGDYSAGWVIKKDDGWYNYGIYEKGGEYSEGMLIEGFYCNIRYFVRYCTRTDEGTILNNLTYDETQKAYVYNNATLYIEDGKVVKIEVRRDEEDPNLVTQRFIFSDYGTTVANPPENLK